MKLISETRLAKKLQVSQTTIAEWRRDGLIKPYRVLNRMPQYTVEGIDAFLQHKKAKNHRVVQAIDILEDRVKLMNLGEVAKRMGASQQALSHRVRCGRYPALWVGGELRMVATDVENILADAANPDYIGREMAAHILGSPTHFIRHLVRQGDLRSITVYTKPTTMPITRESMLAFIKKIAPSWVEPE
ncbi:MAG TPA: helix-turn-helix domain-containing protein, partial [Candidatus Saccharimonadales bacterium]